MKQMQKLNNTKFLYVQTLALAILLVLASFLWQGNKDLNLWDEGFLWYGAQRVMLGEVPIRDFMAYDPARYFWSATMMRLWGDSGIMAFRASSAILQALALFIGLQLISRSLKKQDFLYLLISAIIFTAWMIMGYKMVDYAASILLIGALAYLVKNPTSRGYFIVGICVGFAAFLGRNHGVYGVVGSLGVMCWLYVKRVEGLTLVKGFLVWSIGVIVGFMPILLMLLFVSGFAAAFWESIRFLFEIQATNIPVPVPWPWLVDFHSAPLANIVSGVLTGIFFIVIVAFGILSITWVFWQKYHRKQVEPALVAASFLALPYAHYAYSRADVPHLSLGIFPLLIGCLAFLAMQPAKFKWPLVLILCAFSVLVVRAYHPGWQCYESKQCVSIGESGNKLLVSPAIAGDVKLIRDLASKYAKDGQNFVVTPFWPGAYSLMERKSPTWEIYALTPRPQAFERNEIERIKAAKPAFALIVDISLDGRDDLRFKNTHPLTNQYIQNNFERTVDSPNPAYQIYKAKENLQ
jgi:hypothetical protein